MGGLCPSSPSREGAVSGCGGWFEMGCACVVSFCGCSCSGFVPDSLSVCEAWGGFCCCVSWGGRHAFCADVQVSHHVSFAVKEVHGATHLSQSECDGCAVLLVFAFPGEISWEALAICFGTEKSSTFAAFGCSGQFLLHMGP